MVSHEPHLNHHVGAAYELAVAGTLLKMGCEVFTAMFGFTEIDLIAVTPSGRTARLQVKAAASCGKSSARREIPTRRQRFRGGPGIPYTRIDFFIACHDDKFWVFPASECQGSKKTCGPSSEYLNAWHLITEPAGKLELVR